MRPPPPLARPCPSQTLTPGQRPVTLEELERFTSIIDNILANADLETISRKKVRQGLEASLGGRDLSEQKVRSPSAVRDLFPPR